MFFKLEGTQIGIAPFLLLIGLILMLKKNVFILTYFVKQIHISFVFAPKFVVRTKIVIYWLFWWIAVEYIWQNSRKIVANKHILLDPYTYVPNKHTGNSFL